MEAPVLELETRHRVYQAVVGQPGLHLSEVARVAGLQVTHARYNLDRLEAAGLVSSTLDGGFLRYFARTETQGVGHDVLGSREKELMGVVRRPRLAQVLLVLLAEGPCTVAHLASRLQRTPSTLSFHLDRLVRKEVVARLGATKAERRYAVRDPAQVTAFLLRYPPAPTLVGSFISLWDGLALPAPGKGPGAGEATTGGGAPLERRAPSPGPVRRRLAWLARCLASRRLPTPLRLPSEPF